MGGKRSTSWQKGEAPVKQPGTKNKHTLLKESLGLSNWAKLKSFIENEGAEKMVDEMMKLKGRDFVIAMTQFTEFVKPKLQRSTVTGDPDAPVQVSTLQNLTFEQLYQLKYGKKPGE